MAFSDKTLTCSECNGTFTFTAGEQEFYHKRGFKNIPKRCPSCRESGRPKPKGGSRKGPRDRTFEVACAKCGVVAQLPFAPSPDKPLLCATCFRNR